jgi:hypothetical protein
VKWGRRLTPLVGALVAVGVCIAVGASLGLGPTDDAFITYRHARNFAAGHGLVFNPGERVEATTNFLFALVLGVLSRLRVGPILGSLSLNLLALGAIVFAVIQEARRRYPGAPWRWTGGALLLVLSPSMIVYVWVGLETVFQAALVLGGCLALCRREEGASRLVLSGVFFGLAAATRLEAIALAPAALLAVASAPGARRRSRSVGLLLGGFAAVFLPVLAYRWGFYGQALPNTYYVKVQGGGVSLVRRGLEYIGWFAALYPGLVLVLVATVARFGRARGDRARSGFLALTVLTQGVYTAAVGGDFFPLFRFFVPVLPVFALMVDDMVNFGLGASPSAASPPPRPAFPYYTAVLFAVVTVGFTALQPIQFAIIASQQKSAAKRAAVGKLLGRQAPRDATLLLGAAGAIPFFSRLSSHDLFGLTDPVVAHKEVPLGGGIPGHEKVDAAAQVERLRPGLILFNSWYNADIGPLTSKRRQARFYRQLELLLNTHGTTIDYVPMRLADLEVTALVASDVKLVPRLGAAFQEIGAIRLRRLAAPLDLGDGLRRGPFRAWGGAALRAPEWEELPRGFVTLAGLDDWRRYPPEDALPERGATLECHVSGLPEVARFCDHLLFPFSVIATEQGAGGGVAPLARDLHLNHSGPTGTISSEVDGGV